MKNHRLHNGVFVAPNSELFALLEQADKSRKPEDRKKAEDHAKQVADTFNKQCGFPAGTKHPSWSIGRGFHDNLLQ